MNDVAIKCRRSVLVRDEAQPEDITPEGFSNQSMRYADQDYDAKFDRIVIVREGDFSELHVMLPLFKD